MTSVTNNMPSNNEDQSQNNWLSKCCDAPVDGMGVGDSLSIEVACSKCKIKCDSKEKMYFKKDQPQEAKAWLGR